MEYKRCCSSYRYFFLKLFVICTNITAGNKILYVPNGWEGWLFIAAFSNLALKLLHQLTLRFLWGVVQLYFNEVNTVSRTNLKNFKIQFLVSFLVWFHQKWANASRRYLYYLFKSKWRTINHLYIKGFRYSKNNAVNEKCLSLLKLIEECETNRSKRVKLSLWCSLFLMTYVATKNISMLKTYKRYCNTFIDNHTNSL